LTPNSHTRRPRAPRGALLLFSALLLLAPALRAQLPPAERAAAMEEALAHVRAERYTPALEIFRRLVEANPRDLEARNWVARLESWKGRYAVAEELYNGVLRDAPGDLEAELGLVDVLGWQGRHDEALERLDRLAEQHPGNFEVLLRRARLLRWAHRRRESMDAYEEILAREPENREARDALEALRAETLYKLETGYFAEEFNFAGATHGSFVELAYHDLDRVWLLGRFQYQNKFAQNNTRATLGGTYRFFTRTWARGEVSLAPPGDTVIANQDYTVEVVQGLHPRFNVGGGYRFLNFRAADVHVVTALADWSPRPDLHFYFRYTPARTTFEPAGASVWNHGGWVRLVWDAHRKVSPYFLFAVGSEDFAGVSAEQLGRFAAQTYGAGAEVRVTSRQGFRAGYSYQNRTQGRREQGVGLSYFVRF